MYTSKNTRSVPTKSTETTKLALAPSNLSYVTHSEFSTTIKYLIAKFKEYVEKYVEIIIADQDEIFENKFEKELQPLSLQVKYISSKQGDQSNILSTFTATVLSFRTSKFRTYGFRTGWFRTS